MPAELDVHCIVDNYATHSHPKVKAWLASRPRWHMHFIPTYSSWLNQVERFFALITDKAIRRGSFTSVKQLVQRIDHFVAHHNTNCQPFEWTATADSILAKLHRLCSRISGTGHSRHLAPPLRQDPKKKAQQRWAFLRSGLYDFLRRRVMKPIAPSPASMSA